MKSSVFADSMQSWRRDLRLWFALWRLGNNWCSTCCSLYNVLLKSLSCIYSRRKTVMLVLMFTKIANNKNCSYTRMNESQRHLNTYTMEQPATASVVSPSADNHDSQTVRNYRRMLSILINVLLNCAANFEQEVEK